jgi:hypothetical protein
MDAVKKLRIYTYILYFGIVFKIDNLHRLKQHRQNKDKKELST